jgi:hypothetical protein
MENKYKRNFMLKKVKNLQEFKENEFNVNSLDNEELGGVLGYWDVGDGGERPW